MIRVYSTPNERQLAIRDLCRNNAQKHVSSDWEITIEDQHILPYGGILQFMIKKKAKPNTGMLFMTNKTWIVQVGRLGGVKSGGTQGSGNLKPNKFRIFI